MFFFLHKLAKILFSIRKSQQTFTVDQIIVKMTLVLDAIWPNKHTTLSFPQSIFELTIVYAAISILDLPFDQPQIELPDFLLVKHVPPVIVSDPLIPDPLAMPFALGKFSLVDLVGEDFPAMAILFAIPEPANIHLIVGPEYSFPVRFIAHTFPEILPATLLQLPVLAVLKGPIDHIRVFIVGKPQRLVEGTIVGDFLLRGDLWGRLDNRPIRQQDRFGQLRTRDVVRMQHRGVQDARLGLYGRKQRRVLLTREDRQVLLCYQVRRPPLY